MIPTSSVCSKFWYSVVAYPSLSDISWSNSAGLILSACRKPEEILLPSIESEADIVLQNGKIITVDPKDSIAQAIAAKDGLIIKVGSDEDIKAYIGPKTSIINLKGKTVTPGLIDSHIHVLPRRGLRCHRRGLVTRRGDDCKDAGRCDPDAAGHRGCTGQQRPALIRGYLVGPQAWMHKPGSDSHTGVQR